MITLKNGDTLKVLCRFQHMGKAFTGAKIRAAIGHGGTFGFDEKLWAEIAVGNIQTDVSWTDYTIYVNILIKNVGGLLIPASSTYEVYAKLIGIPGPDIFWYGPANDITLETDISEEPAAFQNLSVTYTKA